MNMLEKARYRAIFCGCLSGKDSAIEPIDETLVLAAELEGVNAIVSYGALQQEHWHAVDDIRNQMKEELREQAAWALRMKHAASQVFEALNRAGIVFVCMRGIAVAEALYADLAALRPQGDIDLMVEEKDVMDAKQALWDIGFRPNKAYTNIFMRGDIHVDFHSEPLGIERIRAWANLTPLRATDFFAHADRGELAGQQALIVQPRVQLPYLCFHAMKHSFERLVWLHDIALLTHKIEKDGQWDEVLAGILEYRLERPCFYALSYVKAHIDGAVPDELLERIRPKMGFVERRLFRRHMDHEVIPYLAERLFSRMLPLFSQRVEFWRETIYPRYEVRAQIAGSGCVKCNFTRKRLRQLFGAAGKMLQEVWRLLAVRHS